MGLRRNIRTDQLSLKDYLTEVVELYKSLGFLRQYSHIKNENLINEIIKYSHEHYGLSLEKLYAKPRMRRLIDFLVLSYDTARVWFKDTRIKVTHREKIYTNALQQLKNISQGRFKPDKAIEVLDEEENKIYLDYIENDRNKNIEFVNLPGVIDMGTLIGKINSMLDKNEGRFYVLELNDFAVIMMLTDYEKQIFENKKDFRFVKENELENFPPAKIGVYLQNFKRVFTPWRIFEFVLFIIGALDIAYIAYKTLLKLSEKIVAKIAGEGYGIPADRNYWLIVSALMGIILGAYAARFLIRIILKDRKEGYKIFLEMFCGEGRIGRAVTVFMTTLIVTFTAIAIVLGLNWYASFGKNISINPLLGFNVQYSYKEVKSITLVSREETHNNKTTLKNYLEVRFINGDSWRSDSEGRKPSYIFDRDLAEYISAKSGRAVEKLE